MSPSITVATSSISLFLLFATFASVVDSFVDQEFRLASLAAASTNMLQLKVIRGTGKAGKLTDVSISPPVRAAYWSIPRRTHHWALAGDDATLALVGKSNGWVFASTRMPQLAQVSIGDAIAATHGVVLQRANPCTLR